MTIVLKCHKITVIQRNGDFTSSRYSGYFCTGLSVYWQPQQSVQFCTQKFISALKAQICKQSTFNLHCDIFHIDYKMLSKLRASIIILKEPALPLLTAG